MSASALERGVRRGRYVRAYARVYLEPVVRASEEQAALAAVLACGEGATASHASAARLWKLEMPPPPEPHVTVPPGRQPRLIGISIHRTTRLGPADRASLGVIPLTTPTRTLCDIASACEEVALEIAIDALWRRRLVAPERLLEYLSHAWPSNRPGTDVLRKLARARVGLDAPDSVLETLFFGIMGRARLPLPERHHPVRVPSGIRYLDYAYPDVELAVELDGYEPHLRDRATFDDGNLRQNEIEALGWTFRRFTKTHLTRQELMVQTTMGDALGLTPVRWRPRRR